jgi:hypothetical protein
MRPYLTGLISTLFLTGTAYAQVLSNQAVLGETTALEFSIPTTSKDRCNVELRIPDGPSIEREIRPPEVKVQFEIAAKSLRDVPVAWQGKTKFRGLNTVSGCEGSGVLTVKVRENSEQIKDRWAQLFKRINAEQSRCVVEGAKAESLLIESTDPAADLVGPNDPRAKTIFDKCDSFFAVNRPWQGRSQSSYPCTLSSGSATICEGLYAERQADGRLRPVSLEEAIRLHFTGKPWTFGQRENLEAKLEKERQEAEARKRAEAELIAKREAEEKERKFRESPEYKRQQAELLKKQKEEDLRLEREKKAQEREAAEAAKKEAAAQAVAKRAEEQRLARAPQACKTDYRQCLNMEMLINNYRGIPAARKDCEERTGDIAKWSYRFGSTPTFTTYYNSDYEFKQVMTEGIMRLVESDAQFQNGFGAWKRQKVVCSYDVQKSRAIIVMAD